MYQTRQTIIPFTEIEKTGKGQLEREKPKQFHLAHDQFDGVKGDVPD